MSDLEESQGSIFIDLGDQNEENNQPEQGLPSPEQASEGEQGELATQQGDQEEVREPAPTRPEKKAPDYVDLSNLPDDQRRPIEERINYLYKQVKSYQNENQHSAKLLREMHERLEKREVEENQKKYEAYKTKLKQDLVKANNQADFGKAAEIQTELTKYAIAEENARKAQEHQRAQAERTQPDSRVVNPNSGNPVSLEAEVKVISYLESRDEFTNPQYGERYRQWATAKGLEIAKQNPSWDVDRITQEIDNILDNQIKRPRKPEANTPPTVLNGKPAKPNSNRVELGVVERQIAEKMYADLPKAEAYKRFARGILREKGMA